MASVAINASTLNTGTPVLYARDLSPNIKEADIETAFAYYNFASVRVSGMCFSFARSWNDASGPSSSGFSACIEFESIAQGKMIPAH